MAKKKKKAVSESSGAGWIVSYADLMTLLFAAFVVLYGMKPEGETKEVLGVTSSIREAFIEIPDEIPEEEKKGPIHQGKKAFNYFRGDAINPPIIKKFRRYTNVLKVINKDFNQAKTLVNELNKGLGKDKKAALLTEEEDGYSIKLMGSHFFESGSYRVKRTLLPELTKIGQFLKDIEKDIIIEGHTDAIPLTGPLTNWDLSSLRATYVMKHFLREVNFEPKRIAVAGYGDSKPIGDNQTEVGRRLNRRIEIKVKYVE